MNTLCKSKINCDEPNAPTGFFSSETADQIAFFSRFQMFLPPALGANWTSSNRTGQCSAATQDDANQCAMEDFMVQAAANNSAPPVCLLPEPPNVPCDDDSPLFKNTPQTCVGTCPDGLPFSFTVRAGRFTAFSADTANAMAFSYACDQIISNRVCIGPAATTEGCVNAPFSITVDCQANFGPLVFSVASGSLPAGLSLSAVGALSFKIAGTPTSVGDFSVLIQATDTRGNFMQKRFTLSIVGLTNSDALPQSTVGVAYSETLIIGASTSGSIVWSVASGSLPDGLSLSSSGVISGTPTTSGSSAFTVQISDANTTCSKSFSLQVNPSVVPPVCVVAAGSLPVNPVIELSMSSSAAVRRMMATSFGGGAGTIDVINTSTGAVVAHIATAFDVAYPVFAASNGTFWVQRYNDDKLRKYDSNGTFLAEITPSPGDVLASPMGYEPNTGKIYFVVQGANFIVYELNPATNAVVVGNNFGPPGANSSVFSIPGTIFVSAIPASGADGDIFDIYSVPGYAHIGTLPSTHVGTNQQCFVYCPTNGKAYISAINGISGHTEIWEVNPVTALVDFIYDLDPAFNFGVKGMAYDPVHERIFAIDFLNGAGVVINPLTRAIICNVPSPSFEFAPDCLVCDPVTGIFYLADSAGATGINKWT